MHVKQKKTGTVRIYKGQDVPIMRCRVREAADTKTFDGLLTNSHDDVLLYVGGKNKNARVVLARAFNRRR